MFAAESNKDSAANQIKKNSNLEDLIVNKIRGLLNERKYGFCVDM